MAQNLLYYGATPYLSRDKGTPRMDDPSFTVDTLKKPEAPPGRAVTLVVRVPVDVRSLALMGLFLLALGYTLYFARAVLLPMVVALFFYLLLGPIIKALKVLHVPEALGAAIVMLALLGLASYGAYQLTGPATDWLAKIPQSLQQLERKLRPLQQSAQEVSQATAQVEKLMQATGGERVVQMEVKRQSLTDMMLNTTSSFVAGGVAMLILLYFLLASGNLFLLKLVKVLPRLQDKKTAVSIVHQMEHDISLYLLTMTVINAALGAATGLAMFLLGMPNPVLWGGVAGVLNFVPYVSSVIMTVLLGLAAALTFDHPGRILLVPAVYAVLNSLEGFVITPLVHSRRFTLNPVAIIVWLVFWSWIWGVVGTLLAMPMLVTLKILCTHLAPLAPIGEFLDQ